MYGLLVSAMLFVGTATAVGQTYSDIDWKNYASKVSEVVTTDDNNPTYVYLYNVEQKKFLTNGGSYGMRGILANVGMRFKIKSADYGYTITTRMDNSAHNMGNYLAFCDMTWNSTHIGFDRNVYSTSGGVSEYGYFTFTETNGAYTISALKYNFYYNPKTTNSDGTTSGTNNLERSQTGASTWYLITYENYKNALESITDEEYVDITGWLLDSRFDRNNIDESAWSITAGGSTTTADKIEKRSGDGSYIYKPYFYQTYIDANDERDGGAYLTARLGNEDGGATLSQEITGLRPGLYRVTCQAFYNGDSNNTYLFANSSTDGDRVLVPTISESDKTTLEKYATAVSDDTAISRAVVAGKIFANYDDVYDGTSEKTYFVELFINVGEDGKLTIGATKESGDGEAYLDNFRLFYVNTKKTLYISANEPKTENIDNTAYAVPQEALYRRSFAKGKWEPICLPFNLSSSNVQQAFGNDVELSELQGVQGTRIVFTRVNLNETNSSALKAGKCYVIKVNKDPDVALSDEIVTFTSGKTNQEKTVHGPIYKMPVAKQDAYNDYSVSGTTSTEGYTPIDYTCYYYKTTATTGNIILNAGTMYELTQDKGIQGTTWTLKEKSSNSEAKTVCINGVDDDVMKGTTNIADITDGVGSTDVTVYSINGVAVGTASQMGSLPKGVYITNGKKVVVR